MSSSVMFYLPSSFYALMHFLQEVSLSASLRVSDGGGVRRLRDQDVRATLIDPRSTMVEKAQMKTWNIILFFPTLF